MSNHDYLAACAEDTWIANKELAESISDMIGKRGKTNHYSSSTSVDLATKFSKYLVESVGREISCPSLYLERVYSGIDVAVKAIQEEVADIRRKYGLDVDWADISSTFAVGSIHSATISGTSDFGVFVEVAAGVKGLIHKSDIGVDFDQRNYRAGDSVSVQIQNVDERVRKMALRFVSDSSVV